jgi:hypothetical protein
LKILVRDAVKTHRDECTVNLASLAVMWVTARLGMKKPISNQIPNDDLSPRR